MKTFIASLLLMLVSIAQAVEPPSDTKFDFRDITIANAAKIFYQALERPYIITDEVLTDTRLASFRSGDIKADSFFDLMLKQYGFERVRSHGLDIVRKINADSESKETIVITPKHRSASYLTGLIQPLTKGEFSTSRTVKNEDAQPAKDVPATSAAASVEQTADVLLFTGTKSEIQKINKIIPLIDTPVGQVIVKTVIYEVTAGKANGSAFQLLGSILGGRVGFNGGTSSVGDSVSMTLGGTLNAVISALNTDNRFKQLSSPSMRVSSGSVGKFSVGNSVPTLAGTTTSNGQVTQSVKYQDSGLILHITPTIREQDVQLKVKQELSNFTPTANGVNNSPTLLKRELESTLTLRDSEIVVLGSLDQNSNSETKAGFSFLPSWARSQTDSANESQLLLLLQVERLN